jgi:hypothetical protein
MALHDVHLFATVRVKVRGIDAADHNDACQRAEEFLNIHWLLDRAMGSSDATMEIGEVEYADELTGFLVDEWGDPEHERSRFYDTSQGGTTGKVSSKN